MKVRTVPLLVSLIVLSLLGGCTTRYQDLLRDRDAQIRDLNGRLAAARAEKDDLERQLSAQRQTPEPVQIQPAAFQPSALQQELGNEVSVDYRHGRLAIGVEDSVTFDSGSDKLKDTAHRVLNKIAGVLKRDFADCKIYVEGHTDSDPIQKTKNKYLDNRELSAKRANAVTRYLVEQGVPESHLVIVGFGQFDPKDPRQKERNRRVEIVPTRQ
ncbi:MAG: flagellar motor protein MotB [Planctomycetota bacterium]